jgi:hypothetical protein
MAKDKERVVNPAQAQRRLEKQKALKKGKAEVQARRNEKLARRNPERLQRQIDDLKAVENSGQPLRPREKQVLEGLERDLRAVKKAREALGDRAPKFGSGETTQGQRHDRGQGPGLLGKRRRDGFDRWGKQSDSSDTDESVRRIPMPRDTPPPIPRQHPQRHETGANAEPLGEGRVVGERQTHPLPQKPEIPEAKTVYEAAPAIRNLQKEAVSKFVPTIVRMKQDTAKGHGRLVEPEEMDRLEREGYVGSVGASGPSTSATSTASGPPPTNAAVLTDIDTADLAEEEERFNHELKLVQMEEVEDEDL